MEKEVKKYLMGKEVTIPCGPDILEGEIIEVRFLNEEIFINIRGNDGFEDYHISLEPYYITQWLGNPFIFVEKTTDSGDLILAQTGYSDSKGVVVSYFDKKENCIKEDLYSNLVKAEDELDV
jgi:hypothetical protein